MALHGDLVGKKYTDLIATLNKQAKSSNAETAASAAAVLAQLKLEAAQADATATALAKATMYIGFGTKGKASGGPVTAGQTYQVNELGQELYAMAGPYFTAPTDGYIIPAGPSAAIMAGQGGSSGAGPAAPLIGQQTNYITGVQPDEVERQTKRALRRAQLEMSLAGGRG